MASSLLFLLFKQLLLCDFFHIKSLFSDWLPVCVARSVLSSDEGVSLDFHVCAAQWQEVLAVSVVNAVPVSPGRGRFGSVWALPSNRKQSQCQVQARTSLLTFFLLFLHHSCSHAVREQVTGVRGHVAADRRLLQAADVADVFRAIDYEATVRGRRREPPKRLKRAEEGLGTHHSAGAYSKSQVFTSTLYSASSVRMWAENSSSSMCAWTREFSSPTTQKHIKGAVTPY